MKKVLFALIFAAFLFGCKSEEENTNNDTPISNDTVVVEEKVIVDEETITIELTEDEVNVKSGEVLKKSEDINTELDELLNNL